MAKYRRRPTKLMIIHAASKYYLENGFTTTTNMEICKELDISPGQLTFHFPTKEHLLVELIQHLCEFQWELIEYNVKNKSPLIAYCLEIVAMAAVCEDNEVAKDFYVSAYIHPMSLEVIRDSDTRKAQKLFSKYRPDWTEADFRLAESLASGIEYATLSSTSTEENPLDRRLFYTLDNLLSIYGVPEAERTAAINEVLKMDYRAVSAEILTRFMKQLSEETQSAVKNAPGYDGINIYEIREKNR